MAKKKEVSEEIKVLKQKLLEDKVVIGTEKVIKGLKAKHFGKVFLASNCLDETKKDIFHYGGLADIPVIELEITNEELGVICKKNFFISVLGIIGE